MKLWIPEDMRGRTISNIVVVCVGILLTAAVIYIQAIGEAISALINVAMPFLIGFGIAFLLLPVMNKLEWVFTKLFCRRKPHPRLTRMLATVLSVLLLLAIMAGFFAILLPQLITSIKSIMQYVAGFITTNRDRINQLLLQFEFLSIEGEQLVIAWEKITSQMMNYTSLLLNNVMTIAGGISNGIYTVILHFLVGLIAAFYLMIDKETFAGQIKKILYAWLKRSTCETLIYWTRRAHKIFAGFITGKILDSMIIGMFCYVCMVIFNIEYPVLISVIVGLTNIIPFFGPFIGAVPCILILLLVNPVSALWFGVLILILQQLDGNVIGPFILGDYVGVSAFWIMLSIVIGGGLFGFAGMLLGVPVFALGYAIVRAMAEVKLRQANLPTESKFYRDAPENLPKEEP